MLETLIAAFETVEDPRCEWKVEHRLLDILVIAVCAVLGEGERRRRYVLCLNEEEADRQRQG